MIRGPCLHTIPSFYFLIFTLIFTRHTYIAFTKIAIIICVWWNICLITHTHTHTSGKNLLNLLIFRVNERATEQAIDTKQVREHEHGATLSLARLLTLWQIQTEIQNWSIYTINTHTHTRTVKARATHLKFMNTKSGQNSSSNNNNKTPSIVKAYLELDKNFFHFLFHWLFLNHLVDFCVASHLHRRCD